MRSSSMTVCVVGAGLSGLVSARELLREGHEVTVIEKSHGVGGQWLYDDGHGMQSSSVYASLRLISPREAMGFSDFPFHAKVGGDGDARRYPGHREFLRYIRDFCDTFGLMDAVRFNTTVQRISMVPAPGDGFSPLPMWVVRSTRDGVVTEETFDAVVVASGNHSQPRLPAIDGMDTWRRRQLHCHSYRVPEPFRDEVVVVVGCKESGKDIGLELRKVAKEVHLSVNRTTMEAAEGVVGAGLCKALANHANLHLHPQIDRLQADGRVVFADGSCVLADTVIYCTGYTYSFPFLETEGRVTVDDNRVGPLFEHVFPPSLAPSLSFVGIPTKVIVPLFMEVQARWVAQVLSGRRTLPSEEEMLLSTDEYYRARELAGVPKRRTHVLLDLEYCDEYGEKHCGFPRLEEWKKELAWSSVSNKGDNLETFRDDFCDSELVREGLRKNGWLPLVPPEQRKEQMDLACSAVPISGTSV
ncbi:hypothetical protein ACQ4PT_066725 [Festuca glaucescens]